MKLLLVTNQLDVGGIETNLVRLTRELSARGHTVLAATAGGALVPAFEEAGGRHLPLAMSMRSLPAAARALRQVLDEQAPDVVHVFSASAAALVRAARGRPPRPPVVASIMGLKTHPAEPEWKTLLRVYATTIGAERIILMAPAISAAVHRLPVRRRRTISMSVVGVDVPQAPADAAASVRAELGLDPGTRIVTTIGRLDPTKSHELFIRAAAQVVGVRDDVVFLVVGGGDLMEALRAQIATIDTPSRVRLLGERHDITRLLAATDVYVRPGVVEGFIGITVLEAQVLGVPAVAFETQDVKLAIEHGVTGSLVPPADTGALARVVLGLLDDPHRAAQLAEAGRRRAISGYSLPAVVDRLEALYEQLASAGRSRD